MPKTITRIVSREEARKLSDTYGEVLDGEEYHDHELIIDNAGVLRWKFDPLIDALSPGGYLYCLDLNQLFRSGASKNDPLVRELYRKMGYSLSGYWEVFYWEENNPDAHSWVQPSNTTI